MELKPLLLLSVGYTYTLTDFLPEKSAEKGERRKGRKREKAGHISSAGDQG